MTDIQYADYTPLSQTVPALPRAPLTAGPIVPYRAPAPQPTELQATGYRLLDPPPTATPQSIPIQTAETPSQSRVGSAGGGNFRMPAGQRGPTPSPSVGLGANAAIGGLIGLGGSLASGAPLGDAVAGTLGGTAGAIGGGILGAALGAPLGPVGAALVVPGERPGGTARGITG